MFLTKWFGAAVLTLLISAFAFAQTPGGFSDGLPLCANLPNTGCPGQTLSLNGAFALKADFPFSPSAVTGVGGVTFSGVPSAGNVPIASGPLAAAWQSFSLGLDTNFGSTRGSILERGAAGWQIVTPGTSGLPWVSNGAAADPAYQALTNAGHANMPANTVKCNNTGGSAAPTDCTPIQTLNVLKIAPWPDASEVISSGVAKWNPLFFTNAASGIVHRFNRILCGEAAASSSDVGPVTTKDWLETLVPNTTGVAEFVCVDTIGQLGVLGASRTGDFRQLFGSASGGSQGASGIAHNNDSATSAVSATIGAAGSGYTNGTQVLTVLGGTCTSQPLFNVTVVGNIVTAVSSLNNGGSCTATPANPAATSGGGGSGATLNVTYATGNPIAAGVFGQAFHAAGATSGISEAAEFNISSAQTVVDVTPFGGVVAGTTYATNTSAGFAGFTQNVSAAHIIGQSVAPARFRKGTVCLDGGLDTAVGAGGDGVCHEMARNQSVRWLNSGGTADGEITANANGIQFPTDQGSTVFTATPTCGTATITTNAAKRKTLGKLTFVTVSFTITAIGTCTTTFTFTLPNTAGSGGYLSGSEEVNSHVAAFCQISNGSSTASCLKNAAVAFVVNDRIQVSGVYENQ